MSRRIWLMIICGVVVVLVTMGLRQAFGIFLKPITSELEVGRALFGLVIAVQALVFGLIQPVSGYFSDRFGVLSAVALGSLLYALGPWWTAWADSGPFLVLSLGVIVGVGLSGCTQVVVLSAVGKAVPDQHRTLAFGTVIASGSLGMFFIIPVMQWLLDAAGWRGAFMVLTVVILLMPLVAIGMHTPSGPSIAKAKQSLREAVIEARTHRGYILLTLGFFVCGFHVTFVGTHLPAFLGDKDVSPQFAAYSLALIGLFNVAGAYLFGALGGRYKKKNLLTLIYLARAIVMAGILVVPINQTTALVFGAVFGILWLGTVPLTSGIVAQVFGTYYFGTLYGVVFMSHQFGSFAGAWLGGYLYDMTGSYDGVWMISVVLGLVAAALHWPINEDPVPRLAAQPQAA